MEDPTEDAYSVYLRQSQSLQHQLRYVLPNIFNSQDFNVPENVTEDLESLTLATLSLTQLIKFYKKHEKRTNPDQVIQAQNEDKAEYEGMLRTLSGYFDSTGVILFGHYCSLCRFSSFDVHEWQNHILCMYHVNVLHYLRTASDTARYDFKICTVCLLVFFGEMGHIDSILDSESHRSYHFKMENLLMRSYPMQYALPQVPREWMPPAVPQSKNFKPHCNQGKSPEQNLKEEELKMKNSIKYSTVVLKEPKNKKRNPIITNKQNAQKSQPESTSNQHRNVPQLCPENKITNDQNVQQIQPKTTSNQHQNVPQFRPEKINLHHQKSQNDEYGWQVVSNKKYTKRIDSITRMKKFKDTHSRSIQSFQKAPVNAESMSKNVPKPNRNFAPKRKPPVQEDMVQKSSFNGYQKSIKILRAVEDAGRQPIEARDAEKATKLLLSEDNAPADEATEVLTNKRKLLVSENNAPIGDENEDAGKLPTSENIESEGDEASVAGKLLASKEIIPAGEENKAPVAEILQTSEDIELEGEEAVAGKLLASKEITSAGEENEAPVAEILQTSKDIESEGEEEAPVAGKLPASQGFASADKENEVPTDAGFNDHQMIIPILPCIEEVAQKEASDASVQVDVSSNRKSTKSQQDKELKNLAKESINLKETEIDNSKQQNLKSDVKSDTIDNQETNIEESKEGKKKRKNKRGRNKKNKIINEGKVINQDVQEVNNETLEIVQSGDNIFNDALFTVEVEMSQDGVTHLIIQYEGQTSDEIDAEELLLKLKNQKVNSNFSFVGFCIHCYEMFDRCEWSNHLSSHEYVETEWCEKCDTTFCGDKATIKEILEHPAHLSIDYYNFRDVFFIFERPRKKKEFEKNGKFEFTGYCLDCDLDYNINDWDKHVKSHENWKECINCDECNMSFYGDETDIENLLKSKHHFSIHTIAINIEDLILKILDIKKNKFDRDSNPEFIGLCVACSKIFESSFDWCEHLDVHKEDNYDELLCEECNTSFLGQKDTIENLCFNNQNHKNIDSLYS